MDEKELSDNLIEILQIDKCGISAESVRDTIDDVLALGKKYERKRIREDVEAKQFETELPDDDGFLKVVHVGDIDMWKD